MTAAQESMPYSGEPDMFDLITRELAEHMVDPYLTYIHHEAKLCEEMINEPGSPDVAEMIREFNRYLDEKWRYSGELIELTGQAWVRREPDERMVTELWVGKQVRSNGFTFFKDSSSASFSERLRIGYDVRLLSDDDESPVSAVILIDDILQVELPLPSPEMREQRFAYYFPDEADRIDELTFNSVRTDQVLLSFGEYFIDADLDDPQAVEHLVDATAYLTRRAELEPHVNYKVSILGDILLNEGNNIGKPAKIVKPYVHTMQIRKLHLRPADTKATAVSGTHRCVPYIEAVSFEEDGRDRELIIPCASITSIYSLRFDSAP